MAYRRDNEAAIRASSLTADEMVGRHYWEKPRLATTIRKAPNMPISPLLTPSYDSISWLPINGESRKCMPEISINLIRKEISKLTSIAALSWCQIYRVITAHVIWAANMVTMAIRVVAWKPMRWYDANNKYRAAPEWKWSENEAEEADMS